MGVRVGSDGGGCRCFNSDGLGGVGRRGDGLGNLVVCFFFEVVMVCIRVGLAVICYWVWGLDKCYPFMDSLILLWDCYLSDSYVRSLLLMKENAHGM